MTLISRKTYDFSIFRCDENEHLIAITDRAGRIHVIVKSNDKEFVVGEQNSSRWEFYAFNNFTLLGTEVYFKNARDMISVARLKVVDGEETVETEELDHFYENVLALSCTGDDRINILTDEGNIFCYRNKDFEWCSQFDWWTTDIIYKLWGFGFHWSDEKIYSWLSRNIPEEQLQFTKLKSAAIHTHNHVVLLGTCQGSVHVYKQPYKENDKLKMYKSKPDRIINMNKYSEVGYCSKHYVKQVVVVETLYGHRLLVLCSHWVLLCVDLLHKQLKVTTGRKEEENKKRTARHTTRAEPLKRVYMTRSMAKCLRNNKKPRLL